MPRVFTYLLAFVLLATIGINVADYAMGLEDYNKTPYQQAFSSIGANSLEFRLDCWAKIKKDPEHKYQKQIDEISQALGTRLERTKREETDNKSFKYQGWLDGARYNIVFRETNGDITYIIVTLVFACDRQNIITCETNLNKIKTIGWNFCQLYHGGIDLLVAPEALEILLDIMAKNMGAEIVERHLGDNYVSATLKNQKYRSNIFKNTCNWQIAVRRDQSGQKTLIWIGSPFIVSDY
ncbi:MAG: YwmB family TATA-box binding protein [Syntrophomonadaceae bacterium]|nr:YwmB family TATA-box binding protein [Syntrophomonadaceae bacterium]